MYYRRKLVLGILEKYEGSINHTKLQKLLFLVTRKQSKKSFDFVPYRYGSYSFQANQDLMTMTKLGIVDDRKVGKSSQWSIKGKTDYFYQLNKEDQSAILSTLREIKGLSLDDIIRRTYVHYPYFATKSLIAEKLLSKIDFDKVKGQIKEKSYSGFFTIGYEGKSLESYLNQLVINDVRLLCDVRKNSLSMKYGFSKSQLKHACESIGIKYMHIPNLGIDSSKRTELNSMKDYECLFKEYDRVTLKKYESDLIELSNLVKEFKRVAITCFEKDPCMCHRSRVAKALNKLPNWELETRNL